MAHLERVSVAINQMIIELQKMELDLKCLKCLKMLRSPLLLPCGHIFCSDCLDRNASTLNCPACRLPYFRKDTIVPKHIENMINIHKSMTHIVEYNFTQRGTSFRMFETKIQSSENTISGSNDEVQENLEDKTSEEKTSYTHSCAHFSWNLNTENSKIQVRDPDRVPQERIRHNDFVDRQKPLCHHFVGASDHNSIHQRCERTAEKSATKRLSIEVLDEGCNDGHENNATKPKKQKANNQANSRIDDDETVDMEALRSQSESENNSEDHPIAYQAGSSESLFANRFYECEFCKLSEISLGTGLMLHILNGEQVRKDDASRRGVVHAHEKCVAWAPQIYFKGETVCNLKKELLRASKLNCHQCGKKGAALGCYVKSCRRSYHVPCAYGISDCRWDCENYHVLCPAHKGRMLPCDESKEANELL